MTSVVFRGMREEQTIGTTCGGQIDEGGEEERREKGEGVDTCVGSAAQKESMLMYS